RPRLHAGDGARAPAADRHDADRAGRWKEAPEMSADALEARCSTAIAARYLGCTRRHVEKLITAGALEAWDVRLPGAKRARWSVAVASVRVLLLARHRNTRTEDADASVPTARQALDVRG